MSENHRNKEAANSKEKSNEAAHSKEKSAVIISGDTGGAVKEDSALSVSGDLNAFQKKSVIEFREIEGLRGKYGSFSIEENGQWTYVLNNSKAGVQSLAAGEIVTERFLVSTEGGTASQYITITVTGTNDAATLSGSAAGTVTEDVTTSVTGSLSVFDVDNGQAYTRAITDQAGAYGRFSIDANGNWTYNLNNTAANVQALAAGEVATETFTVTSLDGTATQNVTVNVAGTNDVASFSGTFSGAVVEDGSFLTSGALPVSDADFGQSFVQAVSNQAGSYGTFGIDANGNWTYNLNNGAANVQALAAGQQVQDGYTVHSLDGSADQVVSVNVTGSNDAPTLTAGAPSATLIEQGGAVAGVATSVVSLIKADVDGIVSYDTTGWTQLTSTTFQKAGAYGSAVLNTTANTLSYTLDNAKAATNALNTGTTVMDAFNVEAVDAFGSSATAPVSFSIQGSNDSLDVIGTKLLTFDVYGLLGDYSGFNFTARDSYHFPNPDWYGTGSKVYNANAGHYSDMVASNGADFSVDKLDISNYGGANQVDIIGFNNGAEIYSKHFVLTPQMQTVALDYANIDDLQIVVTNGSYYGGSMYMEGTYAGGYGWWFIDNISVA